MWSLVAVVKTPAANPLSIGIRLKVKVRSDELSEPFFSFGPLTSLLHLHGSLCLQPPDKVHDFLWQKYGINTRWHQRDLRAITEINTVGGNILLQAAGNSQRQRFIRFGTYKAGV